MSHSNREAPRELVAVLWSIAGVLAVFFAVAVSSLFILKHYFPVSADDITVKTESCEGGAKVAINNYPGDNNIIKYITDGSITYKTGEVLKPLGGLFQCSRYCVPGLTPNTVVDQATREKVSAYLTGGTIGGKPIAFTANGDSFMQEYMKWKNEKDETKKQEIADTLKRTIIISQSKAKCAGPNSSDYAQPIKNKEQEEVKITEPNTTAQQKPEEEGKTEPKEDEVPATTNYTAEEPVAGGPKTDQAVPGAAGGGAEKNVPTEKEIATARTKLNECVYKSNNLYNKLNADTSGRYGAKIKDADMTSYYKSVIALIARRKITQDPIKDLKICTTLLSNLNKADTAIVKFRSANRNFDPWDEETNNNQKYGFSPAEQASRTKEEIQRAYNSEVYLYWTMPKKKLTAYGYGWVIYAKNGSFKDKLFATFVRDKEENTWYWSLHAYSTAYKAASYRNMWTRYTPTGPYGLGGFDTQGGELYPKFMPPPFDNIKYINNKL